MLPWAGLAGLGKSWVGPEGRLGVGGAGIGFFFESLKSWNVPSVGIFFFLRPLWMGLDFALSKWIVLPLFSTGSTHKVRQRLGQIGGELGCSEQRDEMDQDGQMN